MRKSDYVLSSDVAELVTLCEQFVPNKNDLIFLVQGIINAGFRKDH